MHIFDFDLPELIRAVGYLGLFGIVFAESGLLVGFFLPGDSLLFTAGFLASQEFLRIEWVIAACLSGAILGDQVGYAFGRRVGPAIFKREDSLLFHKDHIDRAKQFYNKYGAKTIVIARFVPIVRTFAPILAGVGQMEYKTFVTYNAFGGIIWAVGLPIAGYYLGRAIPNIDHYLLPIIAGIVIISVVPAVWHVWRDYRHIHREKQATRRNA